MPSDALAENVSGADAGAGAPATPTSLFDGLSPDVVNKLMATGSRHRASRSEVLYCQGETVDRLFVVESGSFKLVRQSDDGKELIIALAGPGDLFGAISDRAPAENHVQALELSKCLSFPLEAVRIAIDCDATLAIRLLRYLERQHHRSQRAAASVVFDTVPERLAALIAATCDPRTGLLRFPLNQTEIANLIGSSRETVCSILNRFRREGTLTLARGRIQVLDRKRLP